MEDDMCTCGHQEDEHDFDSTCTDPSCDCEEFDLCEEYEDGDQ